VPPEGAVVLGNFEGGSFGKWKSLGSAFGRRAERGPLPGQGRVRQYGGRYYATSYHGGDESTGKLVSPAFVIEGSKMTFKISGGANKEKLRVDLIIDGQTVKSATGKRSETMREEMWNLAPYLGQTATIEVIDESKGAWGHINVDEFWIWEK
jgi:hypothetical protein